MPSTVHIQLFENAIDKTDALILDMINGTQPSSTAIIAWQQAMVNLGLISSANTGGSGAGGGQAGGGGQTGDNNNPPPTTTNPNDMTNIELAELIQESTHWLHDSLFQNLQGILQSSNQVALSSINSQFNSLRNDIDGLTNSIVNAQNQNTATILNAISDIANTGSGGSEQLLSNIQQLFITQHNRLEQSIDGMVEGFISVVEGGDNRIVSAINELSIRNDGSGGGSGEPNYWTSGKIDNVLNLIDDIRMAIIAKDLSPIINNVINVDSDGDDTQDTDSSASTGNPFIDQLLGNEALLGIFAPLKQQLIENSDATATALDLLMGWGKGQFDDIDELSEAFKNAGLTGQIMNTLWNVLGGLFLFMGMGNAVSAPYLNNMQTLARRDAKDGLLPDNILIESWIRELYGKDWILDQFEKLGYGADLAEVFVDNARIQLQDYYLKTLLLRGEIDETHHDTGMERLGYKPSDVELIKKTYETIPSLNDLIVFMKRDVYSDSLSQSLGWDEEYNLIKDRFENDLKVHGVDSDYAKYFYRASWEMPSPQMAFEMFQRKIIDHDTVMDLLKILDYPKLWRDRLIQMNYKLLTRVDIRRMHKMGVLNDDQTKYEYERIGLSPSDAQLMLDWTKAYNAGGLEDSERDLTRSQIIQAYTLQVITFEYATELLEQLGYSGDAIYIMLTVADLTLKTDRRKSVLDDNHRRIINAVSKGYIQGYINQQTAQQYLESTGYTPEEITSELTTLDYERNLLIREETIKQVQDCYLKYRIDDINVLSILQIEGFKPDEQQKILRQWKTLRADNVKTPTLANVTRWLKKGLIDETRYTQYLREMDYDDETIGYFILDVLSPNDE